MSGDESVLTVSIGASCPKCTWYHDPGDPCLKDGKPIPTPDDTAAPEFPPYTYGKRRRNPYYLAGRNIDRFKDGEPVELMISAKADVTDVIHAFGLGYDLGEVVAKICRLHRKAGTDIRQEFIKMHEHIQAAEDAWVASKED